MDEITFANGEKYNCSFLSVIPGKAFVALSGVTFAEAAAVFSDPEKTARMECGGHALVGFSELTMLAVQPYGIQAVLLGGTEQAIESEE